MANTYSDIALPDASGVMNLVAIPAAQNTIATATLSQVCDLWITPTGADAAFSVSAGNVTYTSANVVNTVTDNTKTKWVEGYGGVAEPEETTYTGAKRRLKIPERLYTLTFNVEVGDDTQRDFLRQLQSGWIDFTFWYANLGGNLYGFDNGITPSSANARLALGEGEGDFEIGTIIIQWRVSYPYGDPPRYATPAEAGSA